MNKTVTTKERLFRCFLHIPVGIFTVFCGYVGWSYALVFFGGFMVYELNEDIYHLKDKAYIDIYGYLIGVAIGVVALFIYKEVLGRV